jgi:DNA-binding response OmpR family regulator
MTGIEYARIISQTASAQSLCGYVFPCSLLLFALIVYTLFKEKNLNHIQTEQAKKVEITPVLAYTEEQVQTDAATDEDIVPVMKIEMNRKQETLAREPEIYHADRKNISIIEDDPLLSNYLTGIVGDHYNVVDVDDSENIIAAIQDKQPDLILIDILLSKINGIELCSKIKENDETSHIAVILLSATLSEEVRQKGIDAGADDYITKPFDHEYLLAHIDELCQKQSILQNLLLETVSDVLDLKTTPDKHFIDGLAGCIEMNMEELSMEELSTKMKLSKSLIYKKVKQLTGKSVVEFIRFVRLRKAAIMLVNSSFLIKEVAYKTGFNDMKYFRKHFKQQYGMNPVVFQKKLKIQTVDTDVA